MATARESSDHRRQASGPSASGDGSPENLAEAAGKPVRQRKQLTPEEKIAALRRHNALNPQAEEVIDELFLSHDFFDPHDLVQVKYEMLRRVHAEGQSVTNTAGAFGFFRQSFYQAQMAWTQAGLVGLMPQRKGPRRAHKLSEEVLEFIQHTKAEEPSLRSSDLAERVRGKFGLSLHPRSIERGLARRPKNSLKQKP